MKRNKLILCLGIVLCLLSSVLYVEKIHTKTWQDAYRDVLAGKMFDDGTEFDAKYFALFDIDKDNVPEMFLTKCAWYNEEWYQIEDDGGMLWLDGGIIAKYVDGKVNVLFDSISMNELYYGLESGELIIWFPNNWCNGLWTYKVKDNELKMCSHIRANDALFDESKEYAYYLKFVYDESGKEFEPENIMEDYPNSLRCVTEEYIAIAPYYELTNENIERMCKGEIE